MNYSLFAKSPLTEADMATQSHSHKCDKNLSADSELEWAQLATVAYCWSDHRNPEIDRAWWKSAGRRHPPILMEAIPTLYEALQRPEPRKEARTELDMELEPA